MQRPFEVRPWTSREAINGGTIRSFLVTNGEVTGFVRDGKIGSRPVARRKDRSVNVIVVGDRNGTETPIAKKVYGLLPNFLLNLRVAKANRQIRDKIEWAGGLPVLWLNIPEVSRFMGGAGVAVSSHRPGDTPNEVRTYIMGGYSDKTGKTRMVYEKDLPWIFTADNSAAQRRIRKLRNKARRKALRASLLSKIGIENGKPMKVGK